MSFSVVQCQVVLAVLLVHHQSATQVVDNTKAEQKWFESLERRLNIINIPENSNKKNTEDTGSKISGETNEHKADTIIKSITYYEPRRYKQKKERKYHIVEANVNDKIGSKIFQERNELKVYPKSRMSVSPIRRKQTVFENSEVFRINGTDRITGGALFKNKKKKAKLNFKAVANTTHESKKKKVKRNKKKNDTKKLAKHHLARKLVKKTRNRRKRIVKKQHTVKKNHTVTENEIVKTLYITTSAPDKQGKPVEIIVRIKMAE